jgi:hypothetical protein
LKTAAARAAEKTDDPELYLRLTREFAGRLRGPGFTDGGSAAQARDEL